MIKGAYAKWDFSEALKETKAKLMSLLLQVPASRVWFRQLTWTIILDS